MVAGFDDDVLETAVERRDVLEVLAAEPHHRKELQETLDISKTTCHRIVRTFDNQGLLRRTERGYELTELGTIVADQVGTFESLTRTAYELQPLIEALVDAGIDFDIELFSDVEVTTPSPGNPYPHVDKQLALLRESDVLRVMDHGQLIPPAFLDEAIELILETGIKSEFVVTEEIAIGNVEVAPELNRKVAESDATTGKYFVYDDIPFGLALYDGHLDLRIYDDETGMPVLYADVANPDEELREWGMRLFEAFRQRAEPAASLDAYPDWAPDTGIESDQ